MRRSPFTSAAAALLISAAAAAPVHAQSASCGTSLLPVPPAPTDAAVLQARRSALRNAIGRGVAIVPATSPSRRPDAGRSPSSDFEYLTGLELPAGWLVLVVDARDDGGDFLYVDPDAGAPGPAGTVEEITGLGPPRCLEAARHDLAGWLRASGAGTAPVPLHVSTGPRRTLDPAIPAIIDTSGLEIVDLRPVLARLRVVKNDEELRRLRRAAEISALGALEGMRATEPGLGESDIQQVIESAFHAGGAARTSFPSIIASGANALELHYNDNASVLETDELLLTDVGAEFEGYAGDVTRTYPVSGRFSDRQRELYELVLSTQLAAIDAVRPGATIEELNRIARRHMSDHSGDLCGDEGCARYFIHGLAHHLGLDVHDPGLPGLSLAPGMVLTIEPGIYIPDEGIGIRIEDDVLVTSDGHEVLSTAAPKSIVDIEAAMEETG